MAAAARAPAPALVAPRLRAGGGIRIVAPSLSLATVPPAVRDRARRRLERLGLRTSFGAHVLAMDGRGSARVSKRADDLEAAFADP